MKPTREQLSEIARLWVGLWNHPVDWSLYDRLHAEQFKDHSPVGRTDNKAAFAQSIIDLLSAFPDLQTQADDVVVDVECARVAVRWSALGTNEQRYLGIGPTHRRTRITGIEIIDIEHEQVIRRWGEWDISDHAQ